jgi:hypothetical protein
MFEDQKVLEFRHMKKTMLPFKVRSVWLGGVDCMPPVEQVEVGLRHFQYATVGCGVEVCPLQCLSLNGGQPSCSFPNEGNQQWKLI